MCTQALYSTLKVSYGLDHYIHLVGLHATYALVPQQQQRKKYIAGTHQRREIELDRESFSPEGERSTVSLQFLNSMR